MNILAGLRKYLDADIEENGSWTVHELLMNIFVVFVKPVHEHWIATICIMLKSST